MAIARALANDPVLILADEPTGNLDSRTGAEVIRPLGELNSEGRTIILVSHDPAMIAYIRRHLRILDGRIVEEE